MVVRFVPKADVKLTNSYFKVIGAYKRSTTLRSSEFTDLQNHLFQANLCNGIIRLVKERAEMDKKSKNQIVDSDIARLLLKHRKARNLTVTELAQRSGVSQAMISKIERGISSPSATILSRLANAMNVTLSKLFAELEQHQNSLVRFAHQQQHWTDEQSGITRWSLSPAGACPELIKVEIPAMGELTIPASANEHLSGQTLWVMSGSLDFRVKNQTHHLRAGDCLALTFASEYQMSNPDSEQSCSYIVAFSQKNQ